MLKFKIYAADHLKLSEDKLVFGVTCAAPRAPAPGKVLSVMKKP
jgi:hypothetical protein